MLEFMLVDHPTMFPATCVCGSQKGPQVDTFMERAGQRVYLCSLCVRRAAVVFGYDGDKLADLETAISDRHELARQLARLQERHDQDAARLDAADKLLAAKDDELDVARGRIQQLEDRLRVVAADAADLAAA